ncbi:hypothetical protein [Mesorhizobium sp. B1-1-8]|uniref:hypothetical protein n=1 Tax=Mesorhizobium sp. B1-1-8 TaxID=2589976 RepID=UPI00112A67DD|nr:hypothetical protein [Mesorhizobium sp. B1-1-8]UCI06306.1 hypothetical protein FJ974_21160 [Mesorhizobium sp. B1-1-8]
MNKALLIAAAILIPALPAAAQTGDQPKDPRNCQAQPDSNNGNNGAQMQNGKQPNAPSNDLTGSLQPCGGVLKPPPTGDKNTAVPPATGDMPVIKPGQVPPQTGK